MNIHRPVVDAGAKRVQDDTTSLPFVEIVIPTHNRPEGLRRLLNAMAPQLERAPECALCIVNDGTDSTLYRKVIEAADLRLRYIVQDPQKGPAAARNLGAMTSPADVIVFTDDDCIPPPTWLAWLLGLIHTNPQVDVFAGTTKAAVAEEKTGAVERFNRAFSLFPRPLLINGDLYCLPSANCAVRRTAFVESGGFDESFTYAAGEDTHLFFRLRQAGAEFYIDRQWQTLHPVDDSLSVFLKRWRRYGYGTAQHVLRSDDPHLYGLLPKGNWKSLLGGVRPHIRHMRERLKSGSENEWLRPGTDDARWERAAFTTLAALQHIFYQSGGHQCFKDFPEELSRWEERRAQREEETLARDRRILAPVCRAAGAKDPQIPERLGMIIGSAKSATTALNRALRAHPRIRASFDKEPQFFENEIFFKWGPKWYLEQWTPPFGPGTVALESCTRHTMFPHVSGVPERMKSLGWDYRFIYLLRDPFDRIESQYLHNAANGEFRTAPLSRGVAPLAIDISRYHYQLQQYLEHFKKDQFLLLQQSDLRARPDDLLARVCRHLGVDSDAPIKVEVAHSGESEYFTILATRALQARGHDDPLVDPATVVDYLSDQDEELQREIRAEVKALHTLSDAQRKHIHTQLAEDMKRLAQEFDIDVTSWGFSPG